MSWAPGNETRLAGVIGWPVRHSLSPAMHNAALRAMGLDWVYLAWAVEPGEAPAALDAMRSLGIEGLSVTMPHKTEAVNSVDECSPTATVLGAISVVVRVGPRRQTLRGDNLDGAGLLAALRKDQSFDPQGRRCAVIGAGGAARAAVLALAEAGAGEVIVVNRTRARGEAAAALAGSRGRSADISEVDGADLIVNATPVGMDSTSTAGGSPVEGQRLGPGQIVLDMIYHPPITPLMALAAERGARVTNGVGMLVHQAAQAFRLWTGEDPSVEVMRAAALAALDYPPPASLRR